MRSAIHAITAEIHTGVLFLAIVGLVVSAYLHFRGQRETSTLSRYADYATVFAATLGVVMVVASYITGLIVISTEALLNSPAFRNKILSSVVLLTFWSVFLAIRFTAGKQLWCNRTITGFYYVAAFLGFFGLMVTNAIAGYTTGKSSGFDKFLAALDFQIFQTFYLPTWLNLLMIVIAVVFTGYALILRLTSPESTRDRQEMETEQ